MSKCVEACKLTPVKSTSLLSDEEFCRRFLEAVAKDRRIKSLGSEDAAIVFNGVKNITNFCHRKGDHEHRFGWCELDGHDDWGFCSESCSQKQQVTKYSGPRLIWPPRDRQKMAAITGGLYYP